MPAKIETREISGVNTLCINDHPFESHEILDKFQSGANGHVFLAKNKLLRRKEAIKVWFKIRDSDTRDKLEQGLAEAQKLAAVRGENSVEIYSVQIFHGTPVATMEYVPGPTLKEYKDLCKDNYDLIKLAFLYLEAIENTTTVDTVHGDPHLSNVLVETYQPDKHEKELKLKLCDFGTSIFNEKEFSDERHWRIVEESVVELTRGLEGFDDAKNELDRIKKIQIETAISNYSKSFTGKQFAQIKNAPLRDYLRCFESDI